MSQDWIASNPLHERLGAGERVLWEGQPDKRSFVLRGAWLSIPFSLLWGGFAIFWEASVLAAGAPLFFDLWGIPFVLVGLYMIFGRFWVAAREAARTWYMVTDRRILIQSGAFQRTTVELDLAMLPYLQLVEQGNGRGTVYFGQPGAAQGWMMAGWIGAGWISNRGTAVPAFTGINGAAEVFRLIEDARRPARDAPGGVTTPL